MKKYNFSSRVTRLVAVKMPQFEGSDYKIIFFKVPLDFFNDIVYNCFEKFSGYPLISLSYYFYLLRYRRSFLKYVKQNSNSGIYRISKNTKSCD